MHYIDPACSDFYGMFFTLGELLLAADHVLFASVALPIVMVFAVGPSRLRSNFVFDRGKDNEHDEQESTVVDYYFNVNMCFSFQMR